MKRLYLVGLALIVITAALTVPAVFAGAPTGAGSWDPLMVTGTFQTLAPNASAWYYFDYGADKSQVEVDVDANGAPNLRLAIYTPEQATAWLQDPTTKPVGLGSQPSAASAAAIHDLVWLGAFRTSGRYFAVVTNNNPFPVSYRLLVSGASVTLAPTITPTPLPTPLFATPVPTGTLSGKLLFRDANGGVVYLVNGDGSNLTRITTGAIDPVWTVDAKRIAFTRWNYPAGLFVANADGTNEQAIYSSNTALQPEWSRDGSKIAFTQQKGGQLDEMSFCFGPFGCFSFPANPHWKLILIDVNSKAITEPRCTNYCFSPTFGTDNKTIAYADANFGILTTGTPDQDAVKIYTQNPAVQSARYSPDGKQIVFQTRQHDHWEINVMNWDGNNPTPLTHPNPLAFYVTNNVAPTWSPDGKQILFLSDRGGKWEFYAINVDGTGLKQVLKNVTDSIPITYNFNNERVIDWR
ncbi:MAG: PD40 domain-containing protein [Chloroflexi bacterium]|nr:PD40 domain-containing protein [Chloroflexota bacterium]